MSKRSLLYVCLAVLGVVVLIGIVLLGYGADWTGFQAKTLWDWMELLIIPLVLGVGVFLLNRSEQRRQAEIAQQQREEDRQQAYLDQMTALLLKEGLRKSSEEDEVRQMARTRTLTVFRGLNGERKGILLRFLYDSKLVSNESPIISLREADLRKADLHEANLRAANLRETDLSEANLSGANLSGANLSEANLSEANLFMADLGGAKLSDAILSRAILIRTNLSGSKLSGAKLNEATLLKADMRDADLRGVNLADSIIDFADLSQATYDRTTKWPFWFKPAAAGAKEVEQQPPDGTSSNKVSSGKRSD